MKGLIRFLLLLFVFCLPLLPEEVGFRSASLPDMSVIRAILFILTFSLILGLFLERKLMGDLWRYVREYTLPIALLSIFFAWRIFSSLLSPAGAATVITAVRDTLYFVIPFIAALVSLRGKRDVVLLATVIAISAALSALLGVVEYGTGSSLFAEMTDADSIWNTFNAGSEFKGVMSTFPHPLAFGSYLAAAIIISSLLLVGSNPIGLKLFAIASIGICLAGIFVSTSRGALASLVVGIAWATLFYAYKIYRRVRRSQQVFAFMGVVLPVFLGLLVAVAILGFALIKGSNAKQAGSSMMRVLQVQLSIPLMTERPLLGYGVGKAAETLDMKAETVDIYYLTVALECGLVGLFIFLIMMLNFVQRSARAFVQNRQPFFMILSMFFVAESTQLLVLSLKQALPMLYIGFAVLLVLEKQQTSIKGKHA